MPTIDIARFFSDIFQMIFGDVLCTFLFVVFLILLVLGAVIIYIKKMMGQRIWLYKGK